MNANLCATMCHSEPSDARMNKSPACNHTRTRLIAKDKDAEYVECVDCGALFEVGELEKKAGEKDSTAKPEGQASESLSDA